MNLQTWGWTYAIVFIVLGILGLIATTGGLFLGTFILGTGLSIAFLGTGILAGIAALISPAATRLFFEVFGVLFALSAIVGFIQGTSVLGIVGVNAATNVFDLVVALLSLYLGFSPASEREILVERIA